jgi:drug/metabolite transporter (DMT)-like permease
VFVILAAVLWGSSGSAAKYLFTSGVTPFAMVQMRLSISATALFLGLLIHRPGLLRIDRRDIVYFIVFGAAGMAGVQFTYLFAISRIQVAAAILLQYLAPGIIALHAVVFFRERLDAVTLLALASAFCGCYLVVGAYHLSLHEMDVWGIGSGILSAVCFAWYSIQGEHGMRKYSAWTVLFYALAFAAVTWNVLVPPLDGFLQSYRPQQWIWIGYVGILGTLAPFGLYLEGVNRIRSTRASITATLEPITAAVISYLFLNEAMTWPQAIGAGLVIAAVMLLQLRPKPSVAEPSTE